MANAQIRISNTDVTNVVVQKLSGATITTLSPGAQAVWLAVTQGSDVQVQYAWDGTASTITIMLDYAGEGSAVIMSTSSVTLDVFENAAAYLRADTALALVLNDSVASNPGLLGGVKCGEIIIYPPA